jgi:hypothetical protein
MSTNQPNNQATGQGTPPENTDWHTARHQRREERRLARDGGGWIGGAILIVVGVVILLQNFTTFTLYNWWALFILLPAVGAFGNAWRIYQADGRLTASARANLIGGIILTMVAAIFLLNLNWTILGPVLLILTGLGFVLNAFLPG